MLGEVVHQQARDLELVDERALLVGSAGPVRVAVEQQAEVVAAVGEDPERLVDVRPDRLGIDAAEIWIPLLMDLRHADPAAGKESRDPAGSGAVHRVDEDRDVAVLERIEIDRSAQVGLVARERVEPVDEPGRLAVGERPSLDRRPAVARDLRLDDAEDLRPGSRSGSAP